MMNPRCTRGRRRLFRVLVYSGLVVACLAAPARGASLIFADPNTTVLFGQPYLEFDNPLTGTEVVAGLPVSSWSDAGRSCVGSGPPTYEDWTVSPGCPVPTCSCTPDGDANEIWLRAGDESASTVVPGLGTKISIHLQGDADDGTTNVFVDGNLVATVDMFTSPGAETVVILVENLPIVPHPRRRRHRK